MILASVIAWVLINMTCGYISVGPPRVCVPNMAVATRFATQAEAEAAKQTGETVGRLAGNH